MSNNYDSINFNDFFEEVYFSVKEGSGASGEMTVLDFLDKEIDRERFGIDLNRRQRLLLKCFYSLWDQMDQEDLEILEAWYSVGKTTCDLNDPAISNLSRQALILEAGRRAGKTTLASIMTTFEFYKLVRMPSPQAHYKIAGSTPISIFVIATAATQSKRTIFKQTTGVIRCVPMLRRLEDQKRLFIGEEEVRYAEKLVFIYSGNSQSSSQVGQSVIFLLLDEVARFKDKDGNSNAMQLWSNLGISGVTFGKDARRVAISSAWYIGDAIQQLYTAAEAESSMVGFRLCSWDVNPQHASRDNPIVAAEYALDPVAAALEFEGKRTSRLLVFFNQEECKRAFRGKSLIYYESLPPSDGLVRLKITKVIARDHKHLTIGQTLMHLDPAVKSDSYGLAFGHDAYTEEGLQYIYIDGILAWEPDPLQNLEVSITNVQEAVYYIHKHVPLTEVTTDMYASAETVQRLKSYGINAKSISFSNPMQVAAYQATRDLLHEDRLILPANSPLKPRLLLEMLDVVLKNDGRKIDHSPDGSKDILDCVCMVAYRLVSATAPAQEYPQIIPIGTAVIDQQTPSLLPPTDPRVALWKQVQNSDGLINPFVYPEDNKQLIAKISAMKKNIRALRKDLNQL